MFIIAFPVIKMYEPWMLFSRYLVQQPSFLDNETVCQKGLSILTRLYWYLTSVHFPYWLIKNGLIRPFFLKDGVQPPITLGQGGEWDRPDTTTVERPPEIGGGGGLSRCRWGIAGWYLGEFVIGFTWVYHITVCFTQKVSLWKSRRDYDD